MHRARRIADGPQNVLQEDAVHAESMVSDAVCVWKDAVSPVAELTLSVMPPAAQPSSVGWHGVYMAADENSSDTTRRSRP